MSTIKKITKNTVMLMIVMTPVVCSAQGPGFDDDVDDVPVDGGVSLLVAAGVGYGAKKWKDMKKKNQK